MCIVGWRISLKNVGILSDCTAVVINLPAEYCRKKLAIDDCESLERVSAGTSVGDRHSSSMHGATKTQSVRMPAQKEIDHSRCWLAMYRCFIDNRFTAPHSEL